MRYKLVSAVVFVAVLSVLTVVSVRTAPEAGAYCVGNTEYQFNGLSGRADESTEAFAGTCDGNGLYSGEVRDNTFDGLYARVQYQPNGNTQTKTATLDSHSWSGYYTSDINHHMHFRVCRDGLSCTQWYENSGF